MAAFKRASPPENGWSGDTNPWDATDYVLGVVRMLSSNTSVDATQALERLLNDPTTVEFHDDLRHAIANQKTRRVDTLFSQPTWSESLETLANGSPANIADLHALAISHLTDLCSVIASSNTDIYKRFWNEDSRGKPQSPKVEESCRDVLVDLLRARLHPHGLSVEPEGHMANDKRADIAILRPGMKLVIELKRDRHNEVWTAIETQLEKFYTRDLEAQGFGIFAVFWFGDPSEVRTPPHHASRPNTVWEMQSMLSELVPKNRTAKVVPLVIDVSGHIP